MYPEKTPIQKDTCNSVFITALFTTAKTWKHWNAHWQMYKEDVVLYMYIYSNMDEPRDYHTKWCKSKTNTIWYHLYVESKKNDTNELNLQNRNRLTDLENKLMVTEGERLWGGIN